MAIDCSTKVFKRVNSKPKEVFSLHTQTEQLLAVYRRLKACVTANRTFINLTYLFILYI